MNKVDFIRGEMMAAMKARDKERKRFTCRGFIN